MSIADELERLELRPRENGEFDEIVARFADGMVHVETMSGTSCYVGFYWDDGRICQWYINSTRKLSYHHEVSQTKPALRHEPPAEVAALSAKAVMAQSTYPIWPADAERLINAALTTLDRQLTIAKGEADALRAENFTLAAGQCSVENGLIGDEHGHFDCSLKAKIAALRAQLAEARERFEQIVEETKYVENPYASTACRIARTFLATHRNAEGGE